MNSRSKTVTIGFMHAGQRPISAGDLEEYAGHPILTCTDCDKQMEKGDYVDHFFPYYSTHNQCKACAVNNHKE